MRWRVQGEARGHPRAGLSVCLPVGDAGKRQVAESGWSVLTAESTPADRFMLLLLPFLCSLLLLGCPKSSAPVVMSGDSSDSGSDQGSPPGDSAGADGLSELGLPDGQGEDGQPLPDNQVSDAGCKADEDCVAPGPCLEGVCMNGICVDISKDCDDGDDCTSDKCDEQTGNCVHEPILTPECCQPNCVGKECGTDGCGGVCGECSENEACTAAAVCCHPECDSMECGPDSCGGNCGQCNPGQVCYIGECLNSGCYATEEPGCGGCPCQQCVCEMDGFCCDTAWDDLCVEECIECGGCGPSCVPNCDGKECGPNGCNGTCGVCPPGEICTVDGICEGCVPDCAGKVCGPDGCGGTCGSCEAGSNCHLPGVCISACDGCEGNGCLEFGFEGGNLDGWNVEGDASVVANLGQTGASEGQYMAMLTTGMSVPGEGKIQRYLCLPPGVEKVVMYWRYYSEEFKENCGGQSSGDRLRAWLQFPGISPWLVNIFISGMCSGTLEQSDVSFDQGDVWNTAWFEAKLDISQYINGPGTKVVPFTIFIEDNGVDFGHSAVLVDSILFSGATDCTANADCDDLDPCTIDTCDAGTCEHAQIPGCCTGPMDCEDGDPCTEDVCVAGECVSTLICCFTKEDCDDGNPCTSEACLGGECSYWDNDTCCDTAMDCDDFDLCTLDQCEGGFCEYVEVVPCLYCGDGICSASEEATCYKDCNPPEPGCLPVGPSKGPGPDPGCNGCECEACVCEIIPSCCEESWYLQCTTACTELCGGCGGQTSCGDAVCAPEEDCEVCPSDCGSCSLPTCGNGICQPWEENSDTCPLDCGSSNGGGVSTLPTCGGCFCEFKVCSQLPWCCTDAWTLDCVLACAGYGGGGGVYCGDGVCVSGEQMWGCPEDCGLCGDGFCGPLEDDLNCPEDCGYCGDGYCAPDVYGTDESKESEWNCPEDCVLYQ